MEPCPNCEQVDDGGMLRIFSIDLAYMSNNAPLRVHLSVECRECGEEWTDIFVQVDRVIAKLGRRIND